jgi:hypothetical protein
MRSAFSPDSQTFWHQLVLTGLGLLVHLGEMCKGAGKKPIDREQLGLRQVIFEA